MRVLVVEDFAPLREAVVQGLAEDGFTVDFADDGEEGLRQARSCEHDLIILDLMLPKLDGLSVLRKLREAGCQGRVLILTAMNTPEDRIRGIACGANDFLTKPFAFVDLMSHVHALVGPNDSKKTFMSESLDRQEIDANKSSVRKVIEKGMSKVEPPTITQSGFGQP